MSDTADDSQEASHKVFPPEIAEAVRHNLVGRREDFPPTIDQALELARQDKPIPKERWLWE